MDPAVLDQDARWRRYSAKKRIAELSESAARGDAEGVMQAARLVSGGLPPKGLRGASQFEMRNFITPCAPQYQELKDMLTRARDPFPVTAVSDALSRLSALEVSAGVFHIWIKQPTRATYQSLFRAWQKKERDSEDLFELLLDRLGLVRSQLDPYIAQVVLGIRVSRKKIAFAGEGSKSQNLTAWSDKEICDAIVGRACGLKIADQKGDTDLVPVHPPAEDLEAASGRLDAMNRAEPMGAITGWDHDGNPVFLEEIGTLFAPNVMETETMMHGAVIEALTREDWERVFRKVELPRGYARFAARVVAGRAVWSDDQEAAKVITKKQSAIVQAMVEDKVFGYIFLKRPRLARRALGQG